MTSLEYFNTVVTVNDIFYDSHKTLIERICIELDMTDRVDELIERYLDKNTKLKPKRDPNKPKKPKTSYILFCNDTRASIKNKNPDISFTEMNQTLGSQWQSQSEEIKEKYKKLSETDKNRYREDMEEYEEKMSCSC